MPLLNYTTTVPAHKTAGEIISLLSRHKAKALLIENDRLGYPCGIAFEIATAYGDRRFQLPVNIQAVEKVLLKQAFKGEISRTGATPERARMVAWRINLEWVKVQMALLESEMVTLEQIFLPYMLVSHNTTMYQLMEAKGFKALAEGNTTKALPDGFAGNL